MLIFGERHLHQVLRLYSLYYNETRTHLGLAKDAPIRRAVQPSGAIVITPILSGLHLRKTLGFETQPNDLMPVLHRSLEPAIIATPGYDFREGQPKSERY